MHRHDLTVLRYGCQPLNGWQPAAYKKRGPAARTKKRSWHSLSKNHADDRRRRGAHAWSTAQQEEEEERIECGIDGLVFVHRWNRWNRWNRGDGESIWMRNRRNGWNLEKKRTFCRSYQKIFIFYLHILIFFCIFAVSNSEWSYFDWGGLFDSTIVRAINPSLSHK